MKEYQALGYEVIQTQSDGDLSELANRLAGETVAFVGQSGVGKSSLINAMVPDAAQKDQYHFRKTLHWVSTPPPLHV